MLSVGVHCLTISCIYVSMASIMVVCLGVEYRTFDNFKPHLCGLIMQHALDVLACDVARLGFNAIWHDYGDTFF